ncbi:sulfite exporter TauE/SafE family protein [Pedomonas sp. V897]|uniref:sulfite exporter TauE/SafE family protein n=1 Tax=Pedomonas sp. V897 TaxID=3446482 RepID=UPI003EE106D2
MDLLASDFLLFIAIGFVGQLFDGALGMGFGVISYTVLSSIGIPYAVVSASVNGAKIFTGAVSGSAHIRHKNVDWRMFGLLASAGAAGGVLGVLMLTQVPGTIIRPIISVYLTIVGVFIIVRAYGTVTNTVSSKRTAGIGVAGGFLEATAGVWGPLVTSNMIASGSLPRYAVGTANLAEFIVALVVSCMLIPHIGIENFSRAVVGLLVGAVLAAPVAARFARQLPARTLMIGVGLMVIVTSVYRLYQTFFL